MTAVKPKSTLALKWHRFFVILNLLRRAGYLHSRGHRDEMYNLIGNVLFDLGGVYIKFLQGVVLQSWLMQRWRDENKLDIFTKIHPKQIDVKQILIDNLGNKISRISQLETEPFAVGSFGHVYAAVLDDKHKIIVKVLSPDISRTIKFDLRLLKFFWLFHLKAINFNKSFNLKVAFDNFKQQTLQEVDYISEADFAHQQYLTYKDHKNVVIPFTFLDLSTKEIIVQEYVDGIDVASLLKKKELDPKFNVQSYIKTELNSDIVNQLKHLACEILWGAFHHPFIMGDPHPGNVILLRDDKVALIDFGIKAKSSQHPAAFLRFIRAYHTLCQGKFDAQEIFLASFQFFGRDLYLALSKLNSLIRENNNQKINLNQELSKVVEQLFKQEFRQTDIKTLLVENPKALIIFDRLANKNNRFGFKLKVHDAEMLRSLVTLTSLTDLLGIYHQVMEPAYAEIIQRVDNTYPDLQSLNEVEISHGQALTIVLAWLERVAASDPGLFRTLITKTHISKARNMASALKTEGSDIS